MANTTGARGSLLRPILQGRVRSGETTIPYAIYRGERGAGETAIPYPTGESGERGDYYSLATGESGERGNNYSLRYTGERGAGRLLFLTL